MIETLTRTRIELFTIYYSNSTSFVDYITINCVPLFSYEQANNTVVRGKIGNDQIDFYANRINKKHMTLSAQIRNKAINDVFAKWNAMINAQYIRINSTVFKDVPTTYFHYATIDSATITWNYSRTHFIPEVKFLLK